MTEPSPKGATPPLRGALRIEAADLRLVALPLVTPFVISTGTMTDKIFPLLTLQANGIEGVGEGVMDPTPDYLEETIPATMAFLREVLLPAVVGRSFSSPAELAPILDPWRGHRMAKAMVEMAFTDLFAKSVGLSLRDLLGGRGSEVAVGVSIGIADIPTTLERIGVAQEAGYRRTKLKIKQGHDVALLAAVRERFPTIKLTVDANTDYGLVDLPVLRAMDAFGLDYIEQPLAFDDIHDHAVVQDALATAICLDESIRSATDARKALVAGAARVINIKVGRVGGFASARAIHDLCAAFGVPVWCGGMLEAGVGRAHNIHLATLPNFTKPGDTSSASRYFHRDIIHERLETRGGMMPVPLNGPGMGVTLDLPFLKTVTRSTESFRP